MPRVLALCSIFAIGACGEGDPIDTSETGSSDNGVYAACDFPSEHTCSNLLDPAKAAEWDNVGCEDSGGEVLEGECPRESLLGACVLEDVEFLYYQGYDGHPVEYLVSYCDESEGIWVEE